MYGNLVAILFLISACCCAVMAQATASPITPEMRTEANTLYQASDWEKAAVAYAKIVSAEPKNAGANYRLGVINLNLNRNKEAQANLDTAFTTSPNPVFALALARAYARNGDKAKAFETIEKSIPLGGITPETLNSDKDLSAWRDDAQFKDLVHRSDLAANPCKASPEFRQFDFWIGEWAPQNTQGVTVGTSSIQLILGSCVIFENWNTPVSSGKSFNVFDVRDKKWHQTWVDARGTMTHYVGGLQDGHMVLVNESVTNGKKTLGRMTFSKLPDGSVRQHGESSIDDGKTWSTTFDFKYVRIK